MLTFGGHLEVLRRMLFRIIAVVGAIAMIVFYFIMPQGQVTDITAFESKQTVAGW